MLRGSVRKFQLSSSKTKETSLYIFPATVLISWNQLSILLRLIHAIWPVLYYILYVVAQLLWLIANQMPRLCCQTLVQQMAKRDSTLFVVPLTGLIVLLLARRCSSPFWQGVSLHAGSMFGPISLAIPLDVGIDYSDMHWFFHKWLQISMHKRWAAMSLMSLMSFSVTSVCQRIPIGRLEEHKNWAELSGKIERDT